LFQEFRLIGAFAPVTPPDRLWRDWNPRAQRPYGFHDDVQLPYEVPARSRDSTEPPV